MKNCDAQQLRKYFDSASAYFASNVDKVNDRNKLILYGYYKAAVNGPMSNSIFNYFILDPKKRAWKNASNMTKEEAMKKYIKQVEMLNIGWDMDSYQDFLPSSNRPSTLANNDNNYEITLFDKFVNIIRDGDEDMFYQIVRDNPELIHKTDSTGGTPLHWAADSNQIQMIKLFLKLKLYIDEQDNFGQTPLHIAATCEHYDAIRELLHQGASVIIQDQDGETPRDIIENDEELKKISHLYLPYMTGY